MSDTTQLAQPARLPRVFVIGDSISLHYGPPLERLLAGRMSYTRKRDEPTPGSAEATAPAAARAAAAATAPASLDYPLGPFGENAGDSGMVLAYLRARHSALRDPAPDVLLLNCGLHDLKVGTLDGRHRVPLDEYRANLSAILELATTIPLPLLWVSTTPVHDETHAAHADLLGFTRRQADVESYNQSARELMRAAGVPIVDLHDFTLGLMDGDPASVYLDHVHFVEPVRRAQAEFLAGRLLGLLGG